MAPESGTKDPDVGSRPSTRRDTLVQQALREDPWSFEFFQAVRLIERYSNGRAPVGGFAPPEREAVRFSTNPALQFPASQIASLQWADDMPRMSVNFFGVMGQTGVLPLTYSEYINDQIRARDTAFRDFLDIFNHRLISLFYQAWEKYRFQIGYERNRDDRLTQYLRDFIGLGTRGLKERQAVRDESFIFYTGLLSLQPRSELALKHMLQDYFDVAVDIEQFVGSWHRLSFGDQCQVGEENPYSEQLGLGAVAGDEMWDIQSRAQVILGPMTIACYLEFLPGGSAYKSLGAILRFFSNREISFAAQLVLKCDEVPAVELGAEKGPPILLGWTTWVKNAPFTRNPGDTILDVD
jgi:type VI secretion system protein ImpH